MTGTNSINQVPASEWDRVFNRIREKNPMDFGEYAGPDTVVDPFDPVQKPAHYNDQKRCGMCQKTLPKSAFAKNSAKSDGLQERCRSCRSEHYYKTDYGTVARERALKKRYGMTMLDYEIMVEEQEGKCKICGSEEKLFVDHCHDSGKVRGLLCNTCNRCLGLLKDDVDVLLNAVEYLNNGK